MIESEQIRPPAMAGRFYPASRDELAATVDALLRAAEPYPLQAKAIIAPHAGYMYSGSTAAEAFAGLQARCDEISRVVVLGPSHFFPLRNVALSRAKGFRTPLGIVPVDTATVAMLATMPICEWSDVAHEPEHALEVMLPFLQRVLGDFRIVPLVVGQVSATEVDQVLRRVWGGPETLILLSTDLSHFLNYDRARESDGACAAALEQLCPEDIATDQACGRYPLRGLLNRARDLDLRPTRLGLRNSGDTAGDRARVVGYGAWGLEYAASARLPDRDRAQLKALAREAIERGAKDRVEPRVDVEDCSAPMQTERASFVTLHVDGEFRGCRGSLLARRACVEDVARNAFNSAFGDPRVADLEAEEAERADIKISILSTAKRIPCKSERALLQMLNPDKDGLILTKGDRRAVFLPQVWSDLPDPAQFVCHLKVKAGWPEDYWSRRIKAYRFSAEYF